MFREAYHRDIFSSFLTEAVHNAGLISRPGYYSGRGATGADLQDRHLEAIFGAISKEKGPKAGQAFVQMVADIPVLSATDFLITLAALEGNNFVWDKKLLGNQKGVHMESYGEAMGTILSAFGGMGDRDETTSIRGMFLRRHGVEDPRGSNFYDCFGYNHRFPHPGRDFDMPKKKRSKRSV
jgi:hypothetical protein